MEVVGALPLEESKNWQMWCLGRWLSGGPGSVELIVEFNDLKGLFQH